MFLCVWFKRVRGGVACNAAYHRLHVVGMCGVPVGVLCERVALLAHINACMLWLASC